MYQIGSHWAKGIEALAKEPLAGSLLQVAGSNVVDDGVTKYVVLRLLCLNVPPGFSYNDAQFAFIIYFWR